MSELRFDATTQWPNDLSGQLILEAGCGAGRFTEIVLDRGAELYSFDLSEAVDANFENLSASSRRASWRLFQADIARIPLPFQAFDKVFCLGVLQHCPDVKAAYTSLLAFLKPGGELVADCYLSQPLKHAFNLKYWLRPLVKRLRPSWIYAFCVFAISIAYDLKRGLFKTPFVGSFLSKMIPIGRLKYDFNPSMSVAEIKSMKALSMFDMLSPRYDQCQKMASFKRWTEEAGFEALQIAVGYNGINLRVRRASS